VVEEETNFCPSAPLNFPSFSFEMLICCSFFSCFLVLCDGDDHRGFVLLLTRGGDILPNDRSCVCPGFPTPCYLEHDTDRQQHCSSSQFPAPTPVSPTAEHINHYIIDAIQSPSWRRCLIIKNSEQTKISPKSITAGGGGNGIFPHEKV
jgi:hypothetical protein